MLAALKLQPSNAPQLATVVFENGRRILKIPPMADQLVLRGKVPVFFERGALKRWEAARYLGISTTTLWKLTQLGKIKRTSYGTYPVCELDRHLQEEMKA